MFARRERARSDCTDGPIGKRAGFTFVEMIVVIVIFGLLASLALLSVRPGPRELPEQATDSVLRLARHRAVREGRAVTVRVPVGGRTTTATAFPDGSLSADSALHVDRLTGRRQAGRTVVR